MQPISQSMSKHLPFLNTQPLTEHDILLFHACFLSVGLHTIKTSDMQKARSVISILLSSLDYYRAIAWVTQEQHQIPGFFPIHNDILSQGYETALEDYFIEAFNYDCLWIEDTKSWSWLDDFKEAVQYIGLEKQIPIIIVSEL
jgi:hypothetical protein